MKRILIGLALVTSNLFTAVKAVWADCSLDIQLVADNQFTIIYKNIKDTKEIIWYAPLPDRTGRDF